ncbi:unnamed protein product [Thelazia callipaeda]|uniref:Reduced folate carrier family protein n=1 Tax=Thelazia callipaeda TaxID=103827 RepID=A0A0N5D3V7_THECL|nr:unnamed protein product [Thelazia callipaeda]
MWRFFTIFICLYGFMKELKVGEPFLYLYQNEVLNLTREQLTNEVYPFSAYSYLLSLIPIFLLTDLLLYKPVMLLEVIGQTIYRGVLVFCPTVEAQKLGMMMYGMASASEIAFFSYIYAKTEKDEYQRVTSYSRASTMAGRMICYLSAQTVILTRIGNYETLQWIGFGVPCCAVIFAIFLPNVYWKEILLKLTDSTNRTSIVERIELPKTYGAYLKYRLHVMRNELVRIYQIDAIRKWSIWWALNTCMSLQVAQYAQVLWGEVQGRNERSLNGFAEAAYAASATIAILILGLAEINWDKWGELMLAVISLTDTLILIVYSQAESIQVMYMCYIGYRWNLAKKMIGESFGLIFGLNSFIALTLQVLLTIIVPDHHGLNMPVRKQFMVYAGCHAFIGTIFLTSLGYSLYRHYRWKERIHTEQCQKHTLHEQKVIA